MYWTLHVSEWCQDQQYGVGLNVYVLVEALLSSRYLIQRKIRPASQIVQISSPSQNFYFHHTFLDIFCIIIAETFMALPIMHQLGCSVNSADQMKNK